MLTIHGLPVSVHTRKVIVAALEKQIAYRNEPVIPFDPPPGWATLSPTGKIPVVTEGDLVLRDSSAICAWLERRQPQPALYPAAAGPFAEALWLEEYADGTVFREVIHGLFFQQVIRPNILKQPSDQAAIASVLGQAAPKVLGYLEAQVDGEHLVGDAFGIADIAVVSNLINFHYLGHALDPARYPKLGRYFRQQIRRPAFRQALQAERPFADSMGLSTAFLAASDPVTA
ncbi:glutathione S-transferase family protein [Desertibaculum subflavum]|uniref:glutathione S-transferase family protein n=1 Tax=Desertibaculum subflavum TaxID=2268458 RepID=UPI000E6751AA